MVDVATWESWGLASRRARLASKRVQRWVFWAGAASLTCAVAALAIRRVPDPALIVGLIAWAVLAAWGASLAIGWWSLWKRSDHLAMSMKQALGPLVVDLGRADLRRLAEARRTRLRDKALVAALVGDTVALQVEDWPTPSEGWPQDPQVPTFGP